LERRNLLNPLPKSLLDLFQLPIRSLKPRVKTVCQHLRYWIQLFSSLVSSQKIRLWRRKKTIDPMTLRKSMTPKEPSTPRFLSKEGTMMRRRLLKQLRGKR
jgi:hypothetical protein